MRAPEAGRHAIRPPCSPKIPRAMAQHWLEQGARRLHLVDLNGAVAGKPKNEARDQGDRRAPSATRFRCSWAAASATSTRSSATSTTASATSSSAPPRSRTPGFLHDACSAFPGPHHGRRSMRKDGKVATDGWSKMTGHDVVDLAQEIRGLRRARRSSIPTSAATAC